MHNCEAPIGAIRVANRTECLVDFDPDAKGGRSHCLVAGSASQRMTVARPRQGGAFFRVRSTAEPWNEEMFWFARVKATTNSHNEFVEF